jgi:hypothetical protein
VAKAHPAIPSSCRRGCAAELLENGAIAAIPLHLIGPFLTEAWCSTAMHWTSAPRIVATQEGRVMVSRGETAYVRGDLGGARDFRIFRQLVPLKDPVTAEVLGYEGRYVGTAEFVRSGNPLAADGAGVLVPDTFRITSTRLEAMAGDRLSPVLQQELLAYVPHPPAKPVDGRIVAIYGDGLRAGQNQVVSINRGKADGIERGHVLALWRSGVAASTPPAPGVKTPMQPARRTARRAVCLPRLRAGLLCIDRERAGPRARGRPLHPALIGGPAGSPIGCRTLAMGAPEDFEAWFRLLQTPGLGRDKARRLLAACGSPLAVLPHHRRSCGRSPAAAAADALSRDPPTWPHAGRPHRPG